HDAELRDVLRDPLIGLVEARDPLTGRRVLDVAQPVPHQPADIELVVEDAGAARWIAVDGRGVPFAASGTRHPVAVKTDRDAPGRFAGGELGTCPANRAAR